MISQKIADVCKFASLADKMKIMDGFVHFGSDSDRPQ